MGAGHEQVVLVDQRAAFVVHVNCRVCPVLADQMGADLEQAVVVVDHQLAVGGDGSGRAVAGEQMVAVCARFAAAAHRQHGRVRQDGQVVVVRSLRGDGGRGGEDRGERGSKQRRSRRRAPNDPESRLSH